TRTQVYGGFKLESKRTNRAAKATRHQVVTYHGQVIQATYFSSSGGRTRARFLGGPKVPYYESVKDPYDRYSPQHRWKFRFSQREMDSRLGPYVDGGRGRIRVLRRGDSPRIVTAKLIGSRGSSKVRGDTLQVALGLYDRWAYFKKRGIAPGGPLSRSSCSYRWSRRSRPKSSRRPHCDRSRPGSRSCRG